MVICLGGFYFWPYFYWRLLANYKNRLNVYHPGKHFRSNYPIRAHWLTNDKVLTCHFICGITECKSNYTQLYLS